MYGNVNRRTRRRGRTLLRHNNNGEGNDEEEETETYDNENDDGRYYFEYAKTQYPNMSDEYETAMEELYYEISQGEYATDIRKQQQRQRQRENDEGEGENGNEFEIDAQEKKTRWRRLTEHSRGGHFARKLNDGYVL